MSELRKAVLVVDDETLLAGFWSMHMEIIGVDVCGVVGNADAAVVLAMAHRPALVLMDMRLRGGADGVDAAVAIRRHVASKIIFITGSSDPDTVARIQSADPTDILFKPVPVGVLYAAVRDALQPSAA